MGSVRRNFSASHCIMNRSPLSAEAVLPSLVSPNDLDWLGELENSHQSDLRYAGVSHCLFAPIHYEQGYSYPLIVWLHGHAGNEQELREVMPLISVRNYVAVAPRGTIQAEGRRRAFEWDQSSRSIAEAYERVRHCIDMAQDRFHIHPERIFVAGLAEGGTMALRLGLEHPDQFAGAISLGGPMPTGDSPLKRITEARKLPLLLSVSPDQDKYSLSHVMENVRLLHFAGSSLSLRLYPAGDELTTVMLADVDQWIMERVCPEPVGSAS